MKTSFACLTLALLASLSASAEESSAGPLYREAVKEFTSMKSTLYQHKTEVDRKTGNYKYDCVGFVSYAMKQATPLAWASIVSARNIAKGYIPSPPSYQKFFASLTEKRQPGWEAVPRAADLRVGDIVSWDHKTERANGHAVIIASAPKQKADGSWEAEVYDSTSTPHTDDSRATDERAQVLEVTGRHSGLGHGVMAFTADPAIGALTGYRWNPKAKITLCPIGAGRPLR